VVVTKKIEKVLKLFRLSDGKISIAIIMCCQAFVAAHSELGEMWLQLKTVTPHANQPGKFSGGDG